MSTTGTRIRAAAVALAAAAAACHARTSSEAKAEAIAERNAAARGGLGAWRRIEAMSMSGTIEAGRPRDPVKLAAAYLRPDAGRKAAAREALAHPGDDGAGAQVKLPFVMELKRPRKSRVEIRFRGQTAVQVYDGEKGLKLRPFLGRREVEPYTAEELKAAARQSELDGPLLDWSAKGYRVSLVGPDPVAGRDAWELELTRNGDVRHVWVDAETWLDVKVDGTRRLDGKDRKVWTYLGDWRRVDGVMVPHLLETAVEGGQGSEKIVVEHVAVNPKLDDARFASPN